MPSDNEHQTAQERAASTIKPYRMIALVGGGAIVLSAGTAALAAGAPVVTAGAMLAAGGIAFSAGVVGVMSRVKEAFQTFIDHDKHQSEVLAEARQLERENPLAQKVQQAMAKISELSSSLTQEHEQNTSLTAQNVQLAERVRTLEAQLEVAQSQQPVAPEVEARAQVTQSPSP